MAGNLSRPTLEAIILSMNTRFRRHDPLPALSLLNFRAGDISKAPTPLSCIENQLEHHACSMR